MEISFKWLRFYFCLLCFQLCNGNPITPNVSERDSHTKLLTGIVSLLLTVCFLIFLAACLCCQRRKNFEKYRNNPVVASSIPGFDHGHVNPIANGEFTIFSPLSPPHFNNNVFHASDETKARTVEDCAENGYDIKSWFRSDEKDFPRNKLKYIKELGTGWFGKVVQGVAQDVDNTGQSWTPVVVRILDAISSQKEKILFLQDGAIYRCGSHTNILSLVGRSLETVPFLLLQEYCPQGDLKSYLQSNKADAEKLLSTEYPLIWCCQLTSAVKHIHENNIVHLDLASRNCQLTSNLTLKLGDYGLGSFQYPSDYYQGLSTVPVRWCAPESLVCTQTTIQPKKITPDANVWSLGVTMWEICACGQQPYSTFSDDEVISQVLGTPSVRLGRPAYSALYTDYIFRLMQSCWTSVESRPTVSQIDMMLTDLLQVHRNTTYNTLDVDEFDRRWESCKPNTIVKTDHISEIPLTPEIHVKKSLSASLNNLHGSLDNLTDESKMFIDNEAINDSLISHRTSVSDSSEMSTNEKSKTHFEFNVNSIFQRTASSGSETEDENWRNKVERGAYTEKVRQKSRSVADLMILTHVDYSESEPETPLPSLDYRVNYKNVRFAGLEGANNLENTSLTYGSEGNLLSLQDTFQEELRKLQEERRDSLPFVPDTVSQNSFSNKEISNVTSPSRLLQQLNSSVDIKPANQVFNVYNVTIDNFSPIKVHNNKLGEIIDFKSEVIREKREEDCTNLYVTRVSESCDWEDDFSNIMPHSLENTTHLGVLRKEDSLQDEYEADDLDTKCGSDSIRNSTHLNLVELEESSDVRQIVCLDDSTTNTNAECLIKALEINIDDDTATNNVTLPQNEISSIEDTSIEIVDDILKAAILKITSEEESKEREQLGENDKEVSSPDSLLDNRELKIESNIEVIDETKTVVENGDVEDDYKKEYKAQIDMNEEKAQIDVSALKNEDIREEASADNQITNTERGTMNQVQKLSEIILSNTDLKEILSKDTSTDSGNTKEPGSDVHMVNFDLSLNQEEAMPNSLTHSNIFASTPFRKRDLSLPCEDKYSSINLFFTENDDEDLNSSLGVTAKDNRVPDTKNLNYSLETWDNFLGITLDRNEHPETLFDSFSSEPQSLLFIEGSDKTDVLSEDNPVVDATFTLSDKIYGEAVNGTYNVDKDEDMNCNNGNQKDIPEGGLNSTYTKEQPEVLSPDSEDPSMGSFENGEGWFLHPQPTNDLCGDMQIQSPSTDTYIGFGIDDEIMSAIRNELLSKLPHAQGANTDRVKEDEDWDTCERNEVFLRYNVYNTPLSPIPEESCLEDGSPINSPKPEQESEDTDWSGRTDTDTITHEIGSNSAQTLESPFRCQFNRHTPSQDSCCSNDTLFNLEELICATDLEKESEINLNFPNDIEIYIDSDFVKNDTEEKLIDEIEDEVKSNHVDDKTIINKFLLNERSHSTIKPNTLDIHSVQSDKHIPLPSPEDNPWKQLPASLLNFQNVTSMTTLSLEEIPEIKNDSDHAEGMKSENADAIISDDCILEDASCEYEEKSEKMNLTFTKEEPEVLVEDLGKIASPFEDQANFEDAPIEQDKENIEPFRANSDCDQNEKKLAEATYENLVVDKTEPVHLYENSGVKDNERLYENTISDSDAYEDYYVKVVEMENDKNKLESELEKDGYIDIYGHDEDVHSEDDNIYGILTDIRFTGPADSQMMSTSFSENNDEQGWESGSDSRSSSSGEFIWKEGEHEESLKALTAVPQDVMESIKPMEGIIEDAYEESDVSSTFTDDEETPEFVPSAWDKFAMPSKSALRSPEKTLKKTEEGKPKGVWFKKQKYHCIYEYPKEPESPVLQTQDLWKPQTDLKSFADWEFDGEVFVPSQTNEDMNCINKTNSILNNQNLYQLTSITDFMPDNCISTNPDPEFFVSSSTQPFHVHGLSSQFFPGSSSWTFENATPDSGVEDVTPGSTTDSNEFATSIPTLKQLASEAVAKKKQLKLRNSEVMGGLRHTRNKLKLDLPPSPSAFSSDKPFTIEPMMEHVIREKPSFTTFGKSRFTVQHVDTPPNEMTRNVSFEALPYEPLNPVIIDHSDPCMQSFDVIERSFVKNEEDDKCKLKVEVVRGEASLLDSGDEDSGIESTSTLERKITNSQS